MPCPICLAFGKETPLKLGKGPREVAMLGEKVEVEIEFLHCAEGHEIYTERMAERAQAEAVAEIMSRIDDT